MTELDSTRFKRCTKCGCTKPATRYFFRKMIHVKCGLHAACKSCDKSYRRDNREKIAKRYRDYYEKNKETFFQRDKQYREDNRESISARKQRHYQENKEKILAYGKEWRKHNRDKNTSFTREWRKRNPDRHRLHNRNREAAKRGYSGFESVEELWQMYGDQDGLCAYCEIPLFGSFHVDHIVPLSSGGADDSTNYAMTCPPCNLEKHTKSVEEFMNSKNGRRG